MNNSSLNNPGLTPELMAPDFSRITQIAVPYTTTEPGWAMGQSYAAATRPSYVALDNAAVGQEYGTEGGFCCYAGKGQVIATVNADVSRILFAPCKGNKYA